MGIVYEIKTKEIKVIGDIVCDSCKKSCRAGEDEYSYEYAILKWSWGYYSGKDGWYGEAFICEECFDKVVELLGIDVNLNE